MTCPPNCKGPGSDCLGFCLHRVTFAPGTENEGRIARCKRAYTTHRFAGRFAAIRRFIKEWRAK